MTHSLSVILPLVASLCFFPTKGYAAALDNSELSHLIPPALENKKEVLFGNLDDIFDFHNRQELINKSRRTQNDTS